MRKFMILAISAILVANVSAQEPKKECCKGKQLSKEERVEFDIKRLTNDLMLSDQQAEKFAVIYREYAGKLDELFQKNAPKEEFEPGKELTEKDLDKLAKARFEGMKSLAELQMKYYDKFRKELSARQVEKVLELKAPCGPKHFDPKGFGPQGPGEKPCCGKHEGKKCHKHSPKSFPQDAPQEAPKD